MPEISRLDEDSDWIELDFVEREEIPELLMKLGIHLHAAGLSISDTISILDRFGVDVVGRLFTTASLNRPTLSGEIAKSVGFGRPLAI